MIRRADPRLRVLALTLCYFAILIGIFIVSARQGFTPPTFVYQGF